MQISRNLNAPRAEKLPEIGQHALREPKSAAAALHRVRRASRCEKSARLASMSRNFCAKVARRNCKISGNPARRAHKNCVHSASDPLRMLSKTSRRFIEWTMRFDPKRLAFGVEITRMLRQNCAIEIIAKISNKKFSALRAQKLRSLGLRVLRLA